MSRFHFSTNKLRPMESFSQAGMADITMLLLIFFLLTSNFIIQNGLPVNVPKAEAGTPTGSERYLTVIVTENNEIYVNQVQVKEEDLVGTLNANKGDLQKVVIRADEKAKHGVVTAVMSAAAALDLKVAIATELPEEVTDTGN